MRYLTRSLIGSAVLLTCGVGQADDALWGMQPLEESNYRDSQEGGRLGHYNPWQLPPSSFANQQEPMQTRTPSGDNPVSGQRAPWGWQFGQEPKSPKAPGYDPGYDQLPGYTDGKRSEARPQQRVPQGYGYPDPTQYSAPLNPQQPYYYPEAGYPYYDDPSRVSPYLDTYPYNVPDVGAMPTWPPVR